MKLFHIVAMARNRVIGKDNRLPWHFSSDLKHFKQTTMGETIVMGRKTFESIGKKPLPGRNNFVLTRSKLPPLPSSPHKGVRTEVGGVRFFSSLEEAIKAAPTEKIFIIGGETIFKETVKRADGIYLTQIDASYEGDVFYPQIPAGFKEKSRTALQENPKIEVIYFEK